MSSVTNQQRVAKQSRLIIRFLQSMSSRDLNPLVREMIKRSIQRLQSLIELPVQPPPRPPLPQPRGDMNHPPRSKGLTREQSAEYHQGPFLKWVALLQDIKTRDQPASETDSAPPEVSRPA
jgi:hypothetical protein